MNRKIVLAATLVSLWPTLALSNACMPEPTRFQNIHVEPVSMAGQTFNLPIDLAFIPKPASYHGESVYQFDQNSYLGFGGLAAVWPNIVKSLLPTSTENDKFIPHGISMGAGSEGALIGTTHVTYEHWKVVRWHQPEVHGLKIKWVLKTAKTRILETTYKITTTMKPVISNGSMAFGTSSSLQGGNVTPWLKPLLDLVSFGQLDNIMNSLKVRLSALIESKIAEKFDPQKALENAMNNPNFQAIKKNELYETMDLKLSSAEFNNENGNPVLVLHSIGSGDLLPNTACDMIDSFQLGTKIPFASAVVEPKTTTARKPTPTLPLEDRVCFNANCSDYINR